MRLDHLQIMNCRNIENQELTPDAELTVISGRNGQGKTNLLECIWLLTGSKSFRGAKDMDLVRRDEEFGRVQGRVLADEQEKEIEIVIAGPASTKKGRSAKVNGVPYGRATGIAGTFTAVVFDPGHLSLIKAGPEGRRRFVDAALCQLYPGYVGTLRHYTRTLAQRNALLKQYLFINDAEEQLAGFDEQLAVAGEEITHRRAEYLALVGPIAQSIYTELSGGAEKLDISFAPCETGELAALLRASRPVDIRAGFSTTGPHREDFEVNVNDTSARTFGSQGQQRSAVLALKLAEAAVAKQVTGEHPVMLLDDVLSELDEARQSYLLSRMSGKQTFVTTCDSAAFSRTAGKIVVVKAGMIKEK